MLLCLKAFDDWDGPVVKGADGEYEKAPITEENVSAIVNHLPGLPLWVLEEIQRVSVSFDEEFEAEKKTSKTSLPGVETNAGQ
jgi:hypothetical protein